MTTTTTVVKFISLERVSGGIGRHVKQWLDLNCGFELQSNPIKETPDNGSIRLLVQFLLDQTAEPLIGFDCIPRGSTLRVIVSV